MGCPFLEADTLDNAKSTLKFGLDGWHDGDPKWTVFKNKLLLAAADPAVHAAAATVGSDGLTDAQRNIDPNPAHWSDDTFKGPAVDDDHPDRV